MIAFLARRIAIGIGLAFLASALVFVVFYLLPAGDPAASRAGRLATERQVEIVRQSLGLDQPVTEQFWIYIKGLVTDLDLGYSFQYEAPVRELVLDRLPATVLLLAMSSVVWLGLGVPLGVRAAARRGGRTDRLGLAASIATASAPLFWLGLFALYLFAAGSGELIPFMPGVGAYGDASSFAGRVWALTLPAAVLGASFAAVYFRYTRSSMSDALGAPHVVAARARGLPERRVAWRHAGPVGLVPVITLLGLDVGAILAGNAVLVEAVFNVPGVGKLLATSAERSDVPVIQGIVLVGALFIIAANILVDLAYARVDPRSRAG